MVCSPTYIFSKSKSACVCPSETPFEEDGKCISCDYPNFWNYDRKKCQACPSTYVFDKERRKCVCPSSQPFDTGLACVQCLEPSYWDPNQRRCLQCPNEQIYDRFKGYCTPCPENAPLFKNYECYACP
jgi:hypothetical protein